MYCQLLSVALVAACAIASPTKKPSEITGHDVDLAITRISEELLNRFDTQRGWESVGDDTGWLSKSLGGTTAIATLALLTANESQHSPPITVALDHLESIRNPSTYVCAIRTMIWCQLSRTHNKQLNRDVKRLVETMGSSAGGWGYNTIPPLLLNDASPIIRQFGTVALLEAHRKGIRIPPACFGSIAQAVLQTQHADGGWSHAQEKVAPNTTVAGFNCLLAIEEVLGKQMSSGQHKTLESASEKALSWIQKHYKPKLNTGGTAMMSYLCNLERAAIICGLDQLRNKDWYREGVAAVLKAHCSVKKKVKGSTVNLSFALLFLTRGRVPLALVELRRNKTTMDPLRLAQKITCNISNQIEQTLGWRVITQDDDLDRWLQAPLLFVQDSEINPKRLEMLRNYLDRGGLLVFFGDKKNAQQFSKLATELCPHVTYKTTRKDHWVLDLIQNAKGIQIESWHDGIRDRIILVRGNPKQFQERKQTQLSKAMVNLCCGAAELSRWNTRLWDQKIDLDQKKFLVASYEGNWGVEQEGLLQFGIKSKPIAQITDSKVVLVGGIEASDATNKLTKDVISAAKQGSIVVVEPIGGHNSFATTLRAKVGKILSTIVEIDQELNAAIKPIGVRGWTQLHNVSIDPPLVVSVGAGHIIFLDGDIRNALLGQPSWGVHGYDKQTAVALLRSLGERVIHPT